VTRVFAGLAVGQLVVFVLTGALGFAHADPEADRHVLAGVFSLLLSCLTQTVVFTYFTVTGKMIAQALHLAHLDLAPLLEVKRLKRNVTRLLACAVVGMVLVTVTGAMHWRTETHTAEHTGTACGVFVLHAWVFYMQYRWIARNAAILEETLHAYTAWKEERRKSTLGSRTAGG
jgi:hypothetical protein